jgi:hypothetical protein
MASMTRGPLPPGVYWRRRLFVLALAGALVFIVANVLGGGSDGSDGRAPVAEQAGADVDVPSVTLSATGRAGRHARHVRVSYGPTFDPSVLAQPSGPCSPDEVSVTPRVDRAVAGRDVTIGLSLRSTGPAACTWHLSGDRVLVRISGGGEQVWTSQECPGAVPERDVVVRDVVATVVPMTWNAKKSDERCHEGTAWVGAGRYTVAAAALGGEPVQQGFDLTAPAAPTVTDTPNAQPSGTGQQGGTGPSGPGPTGGRDDLGPNGQPIGGSSTGVPVR